MPLEQRQQGEPAAAPLELVYIGRVARETGIVDVVYGLRRARDRGATARLVIAGCGEEERCLRQLAERLDVVCSVCFRGPVFAEARLELLRGADISVLPYCGTGMLHTLYYSLMAGVPVMGRRTGSASDAIVDRLHGLLLPPGGPEVYGQAICELAADRALLARMRAACTGWRPAAAAA